MKAKNVSIYSLTTVIILMVIAGAVYYNNYMEFKAKQSDMLRIEENRGNTLALKLHQRDSLINDYVGVFNQIEKDLLYIKEQENLLDVQTKDQELAKDKKVKIREDIQLVYNLIEQNKKKIAQLSKKLKNSGVEIDALNEKIKYLSDAIEERDFNIIALNRNLSKKDSTISDLDGQVGILENVVMTQKDMIVEQENIINKAYILSGDSRELEAIGVIARTGGFLGLGKTKSLDENISTELFEEVDLTELTSFPVNAEKAQLITQHPEGSYEWVQDNEQIAYMVINDPNEFWKVSKYAVLETK